MSDEQSTTDTTDKPADKAPESAPTATEPAERATEGHPSSNGTGDAVPAGTAAGTSADSATQVVDKAALLAATAFALTDVPLPSGRGILRVRPLSRAEAMAFYGRELNAAEMECEVLALACVEPKFTAKEVAQWQKNSAAGADIMEVVRVVLAISGMDIGAGKEAYKRFRGLA